MRRITLWLASTVSALFLLFSYHTSTNAAATTSIVAPQTDAAAAAGTGTNAGTTSGTATSGTTSGATTSGASGTSSAATGGAASSSGATGNSSGSTSSTTSGSGSASSGTTATSATTVDGSVVSTRYGNVQVQITVAAGKVTAAKVLQVPYTDRKDQQINNRAVPILNSEAVAAQNADIDMVSGATYTSQAYAQSLQAALDAAHI